MSSFDIVTSSYVERHQRGSWVLESVRFGLVCGVVICLLAAVGILGLCSRRWIIVDLIDLGRVVLVGSAIFTGLKLGQKLQTDTLKHRLLAGLLCGAIAGGVLSLLGLLMQDFNVRAIFIELSKPLARYIFFSASPGMASLAIVLSGGLLAAVGIVFSTLSRSTTSFFIALFGPVLVVGLFSELVRNVLIGVPLLRFLSDFVFSYKGLTMRGAIALAILAAIVKTTMVYWGRRRSDVVLKGSGGNSINKIGAICILIVVLALPILAGNYIGQILLLISLFILMGFGLNIELGYAGLLDLGFVAFFAVGAYTIALLTGNNDHALASWTFWEALPIAISASVLTGIIFGIPVLNVRGDYLAVATLGLGEIVRIVVVSDMAKPYLGGAQGLQNISRPHIGSIILNEPSELFYLALLGCAVALFVSWRLRASIVGQSWVAIRDDEDVAKSLGIDPVKCKLLAYGIGAGFAGFAGAIFAVMLGAIFPESFQLLISINVLALLIIGGLGSLRGVVLGAAILIGVPEALREFGEYRYLFYGLAIVLTMRMMPNGLSPEVRKPTNVNASDFPITNYPAVANEPSSGNLSSHPALQLKGITKRFGGLTAVREIDMMVSPRSIHSVIGPNGAGKTTLFNMLAGFVQPTAGSVALSGQDMSGASAYQMACVGVGRTYQNVRLFKSMTVLENVLIGTYRHRKSRWWSAIFRTPANRRDTQDATKRAMEILDYLSLRESANIIASHLSYGKQRRLELGRALATRPKILLLDEPLAGLNTSESAEMAELILDVRTRFQITILLIEHHMRTVMKISDKITVLDHGVMICEGSPDVVMNDPRVVEAYLGVAGVPQVVKGAFV